MTKVIAVLDDDPTGTQATSDLPVVLDLQLETIRRAIAMDGGAVHLLTNSRALTSAAARPLVQRVAALAREASPDSRLILRGDSTLRGHVLEEWEAVGAVAFGGRTPTLLLAPALPSAGRVTLGGSQFVVTNGAHLGVGETEYARDPTFGYSTSDLLSWAEERSGGVFRAAAGKRVLLADLRRLGGAAVAEALADARPDCGAAACAADAETDDDLRLVAEGLRLAEDAGLEVIARGSPAFAAAVTGHAAKQAPLPHLGTGGLLVVCGSHVPLSSRQVAKVIMRHPHAFVELDLAAILGAGAEFEVRRAAAAISASLRRHRLAVLATPRAFEPRAASLDVAERITTALARTIPLLEHHPAIVIGKGGITSAVIARDGLKADLATVEGCALVGVALWRLPDGSPYMVFPGNVGADGTLADLVDALLAA